MNDVVITAALRTAVGKFDGSIAKVPAADLGAQIIKALLARSGVEAGSDFRSDHGPGAHRRRRPEPRAAGPDPRRSARQRAGHDDGKSMRQRSEGHASGRAGDSSAAMRISSSPAARRT